MISIYFVGFKEGLNFYYLVPGKEYFTYLDLDVYGNASWQARGISDIDPSKYDQNGNAYHWFRGFQNREDAEI